MVSRTQGSGFVLDIRLPQLLLQRLFTHLDWGQLPSSRANQALARISGCITPYVYASLKGSQSSCTTMGPSCSSKTASTPSGFQEAVFQPFVWTLVDLDECKEGVPPHQQKCTDWVSQDPGLSLPRLGPNPDRFWTFAANKPDPSLVDVRTKVGASVGQMLGPVRTGCGGSDRIFFQNPSKALQGTLKLSRKMSKHLIFGIFDAFWTVL